MWWNWWRKSKDAVAEDRVDWEPAGNGRAKSFLPPIPDGFQIYTGVALVGVTFRKDDALRFANSQNQSLELEREPDNSHDKNAIKVIGISKRGRGFIGYVPKDVAAQISRSGMYDTLRPRLGRVYESASYDSDFGGPYLEINLQILGPKGRKVQFEDAAKKPRTRNAKV
jgi:hypothetical protein